MKKLDDEGDNPNIYDVEEDNPNIYDVEEDNRLLTIPQQVVTQSTNPDNMKCVENPFFSQSVSAIVFSRTRNYFVENKNIQVLE